jgi:hypothetical protein
MSLSSEASSSNKTPGFDSQGTPYGRQKSFTTPTLDVSQQPGIIPEEDDPNLLDHEEEELDEDDYHHHLSMKRSVSSTLDEDEEEEGRMNNNNVLENGGESSADDMLDSLEWATTRLRENGNSGRKGSHCRKCRCNCGSAGISKLPSISGGGNNNGGMNGLTEEEEEEEEEEDEGMRRRRGRLVGGGGGLSRESNDTLDTNSSREDVFQDGFETYSDDDPDLEFLKRKS